MVRQRAGSVASENSSVVEHDQELSSMYDYLAKIVLLGPSGAGKSCLLHRFVKDECSQPLSPFTNRKIHSDTTNLGRVLSSQTIGVEFASKIVKVGTGPSRKRIKLQLWDTAGTERFRSVSRSYYRGAAGALLIYDIASRATFDALPTFLNDARALASPNLTLLLVGNKSDLSSASSPPTTSSSLIDGAPPSSSSFHNQHHQPPQTPSSLSSKTSTSTLHTTTPSPTTPTPPHPPTTTPGLGAQTPFTTSAYGRAVPPSTASHWASSSKIAVSTEASALSGDNVDEVFARLARMILTKIELGE
ncbi:MAG: hypothetical protein M1833_002801, partial [Piccolia ochrophora]